MIGFSQRHTFVKSILLAIALLGTSVIAQAQQQLGVTGNSITVSNAGGGLAATAVPISSAGVVTTVTGIPTSGPLDLPTFTFTMNTNGVTNGVYTFAVGFIIDENGASSRRLELNLPLVTMTFSNSGNTLVGNATSQTVRAIGRDFGGGITAAANINVTGTLAFSGNSLAFNADNALADIAGGVSPLNDIINTIDTLGTTYTYKFVLHQLSGPATLNFGTDPAAFTAYPAYAADFILNGNELNGAYAAGLTARKLTGQLSFAAAASGGGGGGTTTPAQATTASNTTQTGLQDQIVAGTAPGAALITEINDTAATIAAAVAAGTATPEALFAVLDTLNASVAAQDSTTPASSTEATLTSITTVMNALQGVTLTATQKATLLTKVTSSITSTKANLDNRGEDQVGSTAGILKNLGSAIQAASTNLNGGVISTGLARAAYLVSEAVTYVETAPRYAFKATRILLRNATSQASSSSAISAGGNVVLENQARATRLAALNGAETRVEISEGVIVSVTDTLLSTINMSGATAEFDGASSVTEIRVGDVYVPTFLVETALIGEQIAEGFLAASNGGLIAIKDGIAGTYVPAPRDVNGLIATLEQQSLEVTIEADGSVYLVAASGDAFSGAFDFESLTTGLLGATEVTFSTATGNPEDASYFIQVTYSDGSVQKLLPYAAADDFYDSLGDQNIEVSTDRSTGIITGPDGVRLRPDYFVRSMTAADLSHQELNDDSFGIAYRVATDFNSDGVLDLEVLTASGKQVLYVLP